MYFMLHLTPLPKKRYKQILLVYLINAARICILYHTCGSVLTCPLMGQWFAAIEDIQTLVLLTATIKWKEERHQKHGFTGICLYSPKTIGYIFSIIS